MTALRERKNIRQLEWDYWRKDGQQNKKPLSDLLRAFIGIQKLDPKDPNSFFFIAGFHGEPFRGAGWGNPQWWGGYCNHGNVLFPTWHRAYVYRLENALRSIPGCGNVALPYWDETDEETKQLGLPAVFTSKTFELDNGEVIENPLYSYTFQEPVWDNLSYPPIISDHDDTIQNANPNYYKYPGYKTVRFPFSGLTSESQTMQDQIDKYNAELSKQSPEELTKVLNEQIQYWLSDPQRGTRQKFRECLKAPNYTVFSNTTSAMEWNERNLNVQRWGETASPKNTSPDAIVPLESPHNDIHLAIGGFNYPGLGNANKNDPRYSKANGDMGENETASFDPIFFFHHCFIDKMFWEWQVLHEATKKLEVIEGYPGTNSVDSQGPTPGVAGGTFLNLQSPLAPFKKGDAPNGAPLTSEDVVNIREQLGYVYVDRPPPQGIPKFAAPPQVPATHHAMIQGINRGSIGGSFIIAVYKQEADGSETLMGYESVLNRWRTAGCANCQTHLNVKAHIPLPGVASRDLQNGGSNNFRAAVVQRAGWNDNNRLVGAVPQPALRIVQTGTGHLAA